MSYNNYVDADAAWRTVWDMAPAIAVAVVKHNNPCGLAIGRDRGRGPQEGSRLRPDERLRRCDRLQLQGHP